MAFHGHAESDGFTSTPLVPAVMPRWQRKEKEMKKCTPSKKAIGADRFIPNRQSMDMDASHYKMCHNSATEENQEEISSPAKVRYQQDVTAQLFDGAEESKILAFKNKVPAPKDGYKNHLSVLYSQSGPVKQHKPSRHIPQMPERVLDAPELIDDYYLNLLDWSTSNILAVALGPAVYLWNASTGDIQELMTTAENDHVTAVSWIKDGSFLAIGTNNASVQIWDADQSKKLRTIRNHAARVPPLSWNNHILSSGCRDGSIHNNDVRVAEPLVQTLQGHTQEVCGLKYSPDGSQLASGGNDNLLNIWDTRASSTTAGPKFTMDQHQAAVKAVAWCPWQQNLLATGGGTGDRQMRFWNTSTGACLNSIDTKSQVCSIVWSKEYREVVSSHGFSQNQLTIWKYPSLAKVSELTGHTSRVLHMAISPDGQHVASAAGDETLRFWKCFESSTDKKTKQALSMPTKALQKRDLASGLSIR